MKRTLLTILLLLALPALVHAQASGSGDPCQVMPKANVAIAITSATTTSLIAPATGQAIYVCGVNLTMAASTSIQFEYGTGATCGTGTTALSGVIPTAQITTPSENATQMVTPVTQRLCALTTGTAGIHGYINYVQW